MRRGVERAAVLEVAVRHLLVGVDLPVAEVADEQVAAEAAERRRSPGEPPRGVELPVLGDAAEELPVEVVDVDDAQPTAVRLVVRPGLLLAVGHEDPVADRLDPERAVVLREPRIDERAGRAHRVPAPVEHIDATVPGPFGEVRGVEPRPGRPVRDGETLVHGPGRRHRHERGRRADAPRADGAVLAVEDEVRRPERRRAHRRPDLELARDPGEHRSGRVAGNALRRQAADVDPRSRAVVDRRAGGAVVGDPPWGRVAAREAPGVFQVRVCGRREAGHVRGQRRDDVVVLAGRRGQSGGDRQ